MKNDHHLHQQAILDIPRRHPGHWLEENRVDGEFKNVEHMAQWQLPAGLTVRLAQPADVDAILTIWAEADEWMRGRGIEPGQPPMPLRDIVCRRIENGACYVVWKDGLPGKIVGTITLEWNDDGVWSDRHTDDACYIHGLATERASAGQGIGVALLRWAEDMARTAGKSYVRLDCDGHNPALRAYYERAGLTHCGDVHVPTHLASRFEKRLQITT
jgi:GNAT superfamily N-acetyltransferase